VSVESPAAQKDSAMEAQLASLRRRLAEKEQESSAKDMKLAALELEEDHMKEKLNAMAEVLPPLVPVGFSPNSAGSRTRLLPSGDGGQ